MKNIFSELRKDTLRDSFVSQLAALKEGELMSIHEDDSIVDSLLFNYGENEKKILVVNDEMAKRIDFSNISFKDVDVRGTDFTNMHNVRINPQEVYNKDMSDTILANVVFIGPFDDVYVAGANFSNSYNALIDPQTIYNKDLSRTNLSSTILINDMKDVKTDDMTFDDIIQVSRDALSENVLSLLKSENLIKK